MKRCFNPVKQWVFSTALTAYQSQLEKVGRHDADLLCNIGRSFKAIGDYEHSVKFLELANHQRMNSPEILAELADAYALINEIKAFENFFSGSLLYRPVTGYTEISGVDVDKQTDLGGQEVTVIREIC